MKYTAGLFWLRFNTFRIGSNRAQTNVILLYRNVDIEETINKKIRLETALGAVLVSLYLHTAAAKNG